MEQNRVQEFCGQTPANCARLMRQICRMNFGIRSKMVSAHQFGEAAKYNTPVVANGKVYLATFSNQIVVYGLPPEGNSRPMVSAASDQRITLPNQATIEGKASDDSSAPAGLSTTWIQVNGPSKVKFGDPHSLTTTAAFTAPGRYILRLSASDGALAADSDVTIEVLPPS
jgi:hypothetical protein